MENPMAKGRSSKMGRGDAENIPDLEGAMDAAGGVLPETATEDPVTGTMVPAMPSGWPLGHPEGWSDDEEWEGVQGGAVWIHPQWCKDKRAWVLCWTCKGFWWEWDHPYACQRELEMRAIKSGNMVRRCPECGGVTMGEYGNWPYQFHGKWFNPASKKMMTYLGSWWEDGVRWNDEIGMWVYHFPLFDYTYPDEGEFFPREEVPIPQRNPEESPRRMMRAEFEWAPVQSRDGWLGRPRGTPLGEPEKEEWEGESEVFYEETPGEACPTPPAPTRSEFWEESASSHARGPPGDPCGGAGGRDRPPSFGDGGAPNNGPIRHVAMLGVRRGARGLYSRRGAMSVGHAAVRQPGYFVG